MRTMPLFLMILVWVAKMCAQNVVTNPTSTQTIQGTGATTIPLVVKQTPTGSITFQVLDSAGNVLGQWSGANGGTIPRFNNMIIMDGVKYPYTGAGLQAAINDALALNTGQPNVAGGALVIVPKAFAIGATTITLGTTGTLADQTNGTTVSLWFAAPGHWTCSGNPNPAGSPCFEGSSRQQIWGLGPGFSQIENTGSGPTFRWTSPAEKIYVHDLRVDGGLNFIKTRGTPTSTDVPGIIVERTFAQNQTGNTLELIGLGDTSAIRDNFFNSPRGSCIRVGIIDNGAANAGTTENSEVRNNLCQNAGVGNPTPANGKGIWFEASPSSTTYTLTSIVFDSNQITTTTGDGFWIKAGMSSVDIRNTMFVGTVGSAANTYDAMHLEVVPSGASHSNVRVSGIQQPSSNPRYSIFWNLLAQNGGAANVLERAQVANGGTAGICAMGEIDMRDIPTSVTMSSAPPCPSAFQVTGATKGGNPVVIKNSLDAQLALQLDSGSTAVQNIYFQFLDRGTSKYTIGKDGANNWFLNADGVGTAMQIPAGTINPLFNGTPTFKAGTANGVMLTHAATAARTQTLQDATDTFVYRATTDTLTNKTLTLPVISGGLNDNGSGFKHGSVTTGSIAAGARVSVTLTWTTAFADATYNPTCTVLDSITAGTSQGLVLERLNRVLAASVSATVFNATAAALTGTLYCMAVHP